MKKASLAILVALALSFSLSGCDDGSARSDLPQVPENQAPAVAETGTPASKPQEIEIVEVGWSVCKNGRINYGIIIRNPNADLALEFPTIRITLRDSAGTVLDTEDHRLRKILPGESQAWCSFAGNGTAPDSVDFEIVPSEDYNWSAAEPTANQLEVLSVNEIDVGNGFFDYTGEVQNKSDDDCDSLDIVLILRDDSGAIVGGFVRFVSFVDGLRAGGTAPFSVSEYDIPVHSKVEAYALDRS